MAFELRKGLAPLGAITFTLFGRDVKFYGGPYLAKPEHMRGVKMAKEIKAECDWSVPTPDFDTPPVDVLIQAVVQSIAHGLSTGDPVYVGCMAGKGRTGLFLASAAHLIGMPNAITYVRDNYYPGAVETPGQERFVESLNWQQGFRVAVMTSLKRDKAITFGWWLTMPWRDKVLYFTC